MPVGNHHGRWVLESLPHARWQVPPIRKIELVLHATTKEGQAPRIRKRGNPVSEEREQIEAVELTHGCPYLGGHVTPCCGRTPFELPVTDRMTVDPRLVTCRGQNNE